MYKASIAQHQVEIIPGKETSVNGKLRDIQFSQTASGSFILTLDGKKSEADLVKFDKENKQVIVRVEGKKYAVQLKEPIDLLLESLGINNGSQKKINHLKAPMPGLIIKVLAAKGDQVKAGEPLLILEAMKMENVFKAAADVTIKDIQIEEKETVEKGQVLMIFE